MKPKDIAEFWEKTANHIEMEELREARKADMQNAKDATFGAARTPGPHQTPQQIHQSRKRTNVLVDQGSSADVLFYSTLEKMCINETSLHPYHEDFIGFSGQRVIVRGYLWLTTMLSSPP
ncbi:hypothetical protein Cni_G20388 [Canna indica]|uniref:Uncharacterized protein n=1 Tax=Canna indica TaxID=4628 RepID=A0AAQ3QHQ5_9LILI|nr:hypothetical protein Cni_G20388 [Canna indica]